MLVTGWDRAAGVKILQQHRYIILYREFPEKNGKNATIGKMERHHILGASIDGNKLKIGCVSKYLNAKEVMNCLIPKHCNRQYFIVVYMIMSCTYR